MNEHINTPKYWDLAYQQGEQVFSLAKVMPSVIKFFSNPCIDKSVNILVPGAGNAYEAEFLYKQGFKNVYVLDFAKTPLEQFKQRVPGFPKAQVIEANFFNFSKTKQFKNFFDYVVEKAFFCAITPDLRRDYVDAVHTILKKQGMLVGVFLNGDSPKSIENADYPPYGCQIDDYHRLFEQKFEVITMQAGKGYNLLINMMSK